MTSFIVAQQTNNTNNGDLVFSVSLGTTGKVVNKNCPSMEYVSAEWAWKTEQITINQLIQHIQSGFPWMPGLLNGNRRKQNQVEESQVLSVDMDGIMRLEEALEHPFVKQYCALIITTSSHSEEKHKYRMVFVLPQAIKGWESIKEANTLLIEFLGVADKACKDASRFYYGATNAEVFLHQEVALPEHWLDIFRAEAKEKQDLLNHKPDPAVYYEEPSTDLSDLLDRDIFPRLSLNQAFGWTGHNFKQDRSGKVRGNCPWHESKSGTSFYAQIINGVPLWRCPFCDIGGTVVEYRHRLNGGNGKPRKREFFEVVKELADETGVKIPERSKTANKTISTASTKVVEPAQAAPEPEQNDLNPEDGHKRYETVTRIRQALDQGLNSSNLQFVKTLLRESSGIGSYEFERLWDTINEEFYRKTERPCRSKRISEILRIKNQRLDISNVVTGAIAAPIVAWATSLTPNDPTFVASAFLLSMMGTTSSLCREGTQLTYWDGMGATARPNLYTGVIGGSGTAKTAIIGMMHRALGKLQQEENHRHKIVMEAYLEDENNKGKGKRKLGDDAPKKREFSLSDFTVESLGIVLNDQPGRGTVALTDELAGFFKRQGAYKNGKGSDAEQMLELKDGVPLKVNRVGREPIYIPNPSFSIAGGIQPDVLKSLMGDFRDIAGGWARFLWAGIPYQSMPAPLDPITFKPLDHGTEKKDLTEMMDQVFRRINDLPALEYGMTEAAKSFYFHWYNYMDEVKLEAHHKGLKGLIAFYSKAKRTTAELALNIHLLNWAISGEDEISLEIDLDTILAAIKLMDYCISQTRLINSWDESEIGLTGEVVDLLEFAKKEAQPITASYLMANKGTFRKKNKTTGKLIWTTDKIRDLFQETVESGFGELAGEGNQLAFLYKGEENQATGKDCKLFTTITIDESQLNQWIQKLTVNLNLSNSQEKFASASNKLSTGKLKPLTKDDKNKYSVDDRIDRESNNDDYREEYLLEDRANLQSEPVIIDSEDSQALNSQESSNNQNSGGIPKDIEYEVGDFVFLSSYPDVKLRSHGTVTAITTEGTLVRLEGTDDVVMVNHLLPRKGR